MNHLATLKACCVNISLIGESATDTSRSCLLAHLTGPPSTSSLQETTVHRFLLFEGRLTCLMRCKIWICGFQLAWCMSLSVWAQVWSNFGAQASPGFAGTSMFSKMETFRCHFSICWSWWRVEWSDTRMHMNALLCVAIACNCIASAILKMLMSSTSKCIRKLACTKATPIGHITLPATRWAEGLLSWSLQKCSDKNWNVQAGRTLKSHKYVFRLHFLWSFTFKQILYKLFSFFCPCVFPSFPSNVIGPTDLKRSARGNDSYCFCRTWNWGRRGIAFWTGYEIDQPLDFNHSAAPEWHRVSHRLLLSFWMQNVVQPWLGFAFFTTPVSTSKQRGWNDIWSCPVANSWINLRNGSSLCLNVQYLADSLRTFSASFNGPMWQWTVQKVIGSE